MKTARLKHEKIFTVAFAGDPGTVKPGTKELCERLRAEGTRIVIAGEITETPVGRRMLVALLNDDAIPFDEIENE